MFGLLGVVVNLTYLWRRRVQLDLWAAAACVGVLGAHCAFVPLLFCGIVCEWRAIVWLSCPLGARTRRATRPTSLLHLLM